MRRIKVLRTGLQSFNGWRVERRGVRSAGFQTCSEIGKADFQNINAGKATILSRFGNPRYESRYAPI
jgi:hypothetical protein